jgi:hypothetical protein
VADGGGPRAPNGPAPAFAVVKGHPSAEETAALTAALALVAARGAAAREGLLRGRPGNGHRAVAAWADRARLVRAPLSPGPGAWRRSALPR